MPSKNNVDHFVGFCLGHYLFALEVQVIAAKVWEAFFFGGGGLGFGFQGFVFRSCG